MGKPRFRLGFYWKMASGLALVAAALVCDFFLGHVAWSTALLYGLAAGAIVLGFAVLVDDLLWWGARLLRALKRLHGQD